MPITTAEFFAYRRYNHQLPSNLPPIEIVPSARSYQSALVSGGLIGRDEAVRLGRILGGRAHFHKTGESLSNGNAAEEQRLRQLALINPALNEVFGDDDDITDWRKLVAATHLNVSSQQYNHDWHVEDRCFSNSLKLARHAKFIAPTLSARIYVLLLNTSLKANRDIFPYKDTGALPHAALVVKGEKFFHVFDYDLVQGKQGCILDAYLHWALPSKIKGTRIFLIPVQAIDEGSIQVNAALLRSFKGTSRYFRELAQQGIVLNLDPSMAPRWLAACK